MPMPPPNPKLRAKPTAPPAEDNDADLGIWDSQCWFPPLELAALVAAGVLPVRRPILDIGCGAGIEAIFLAKRGWKVFGIDKDARLISKARAFALRHRVSPNFHPMDAMWGPKELPRGWPKRYGVLLDRLCVNNIVGDEVSEEDYYAVVASLLSDRGILILRDRGDAEVAEATFRRRLFDAANDGDLPDGADEHFELLPGGRVLDVRLVGDDTPDWNRIDAMIPIRGRLAILRKKRRRR